MATNSDIDGIEMEEGRRRDPERLDGFPTLANFIAEDNDAQIYRRFTRLGARNLLYLQSIVIGLEKKLGDFDRQDAKGAPGHPEIRSAARRLPCKEEGDAPERIELCNQITVAIRNYRKGHLYFEE